MTEINKELKFKIVKVVGYQNIKFGRVIATNKKMQSVTLEIMEYIECSGMKGFVYKGSKTTVIRGFPASDIALIKDGEYPCGKV